MIMREMMAQAFGVGEVLRFARALFEMDEGLQDLWVRGEISNFMRAASGHCYFSIKDETGMLKCVLYRGSAAISQRLTNGMSVFVHGRMTIYEARGETQLILDAVEDAGVGALYQRFIVLKNELEALGLFAVSRKRQIPAVPAVIGIVTSPTGAALRDIVRTLRLRWPLGRVIIAPTLVQGESAAKEIVRAINALNAQGEAEVILIARGGGSIEDLWAFNERIVAEAIAASTIPTVTGIGHETDFTIADFVADYRAATPTAAAAAVSPDIAGLRDLIAGSQERLTTLIESTIAAYREIVAQHEHRLQREHPRERTDRARQGVDDLVALMQSRTAYRIALERERLSGAALRLQALSPLLTIGRGFATLTRDRDGVAITSITDVTPPEVATIRLRDGALSATITATRSA